MSVRSCQEVTRLVSEGLDRELAAGERAALQLHFAICAGCRTVNAQFAFLRKAMQRLGETVDKGK